MPQKVDVRTYHPDYDREFTLPNGAVYKAPWLDDIPRETIDRMSAEESAVASMADAIDVCVRHIRIFLPTITDEDLASLTTWRVLRQLSSDLKMFEFQFESETKEKANASPLT